MPASPSVTSINTRKSNGSFCITAPKWVNALSLSANTAKTLTQKTGSPYVFFSATADFYVNFNATATVPGDTTDGSASVLNPTQVYLDPAVFAVSVISASNCIVTASFYSE